jgi:peptidoglycan/LPS O-acetylase OafA/YrhL
VAVVLVLLFHGGVGVVGGALGVDVFFVLSGFLITALLLAEADTIGGIDLRAFWGRRVRRLVPAALAVVAAVVVHAAVTGGGPEVHRDALSSLVWWSNWRFTAADTGYFESFAAPSPLRHTWSLAVEEQWYLLWPLLLLGLRRAAPGPRSLLAAVLALAAASATAMWLVADDVDRAHFGTDTRAHALLVGAALAVVVHHRPVANWSSRAGRAVTAAGIAGGAVVLLLSARLPGTDERLYHGGHLLVAVATAAVIAAGILPGGPVRWVLSPRPLRAVGRVSYGLYLWHWPVFVWLTPDTLGLDRWTTLAVRTAVTTVATLLSWRLLERPALRRRMPLPRPRLALALGYVAVASAVVVGALTTTTGPGSAQLATAEPTVPRGFAEARRADPEPPPPPPGVLDTPPTPSGRTGDPVVTVIGDSQGWVLSWQVEPVDGIDIRDAAAIGCGLHPAPVIINGRAEARGAEPVPCDEVVNLWRWWAAKSDPDVLLLTVGAWEVYDRVLEDGTRLDVGTPEWRAWMRESLEEAAAAVVEAAPHAVLAITDVPCYAERDPALGGPSSPRNDPARVAAVNDVFEDFVARHPERVVSLRWSQWLCGEDTYEREDGVHLSESAAHDLWAGPLGPAVLDLVPEPASASEPASEPVMDPAPRGAETTTRSRQPATAGVG